VLVRLWGEEDEEYEKERAQKRMGGEEIFLALVALLLRMRVALPLSVAMMRPKPSPFGVTVISFGFPRWIFFFEISPLELDNL